MTEYVNWNKAIGRLQGEEKCIALALILSPFADPTTGRLSKAARPLLRNIFGDANWGRINPSVFQMTKLGLLSNTKPKGGTEGEWYLHLPSGVRPETETSIALVGAVAEIVRRFGVSSVPNVIELLKAYVK
ncbi:MAG TPA: hypothetical protein VK502_02370 [Candidatus Saccharimonadales bacterium]|nr:hypothetical protein [Candidatus Saccharimonadales bacterium]